MAYLVVYEKNPLSKDTDILAKGIANNAKQHGLDQIEPFAFFIRDEDNTIKGGCNGNIGYNWLYVDQLWVDEPLRGKGYGTKLMQAAEKLGLEKKCLSAAVKHACTAPRLGGMVSQRQCLRPGLSEMLHHLY